jgi:hypothetical protein
MLQLAPPPRIQTQFHDDCGFPSHPRQHSLPSPSCPPTAQGGEAELENIVQIDQAGEQAGENAKALAGATDSATGRLLSNCEGLENTQFARTPRTAPQRQSHSH